MKTSDFFFDLPPHLIAQHPPAERGLSRLMVLNRITGKRSHRTVENLPEILSGPEFRGKGGGLPLLVCNNSRVRKARLIGRALQSGAQAEFLLLEKIGNREWGVGSGESCWKVLAQRARRRKPGSVYAFFDTGGVEIARAAISGGNGEFRFLEFDRHIDDAWLDRHGHIPLPPYIRREDTPEDAGRYQTVYASVTGSAAAPTAGLHFTGEMLDRLNGTGIETAFVTLHVGLGTFLPVRSENIEDHVMHKESFSIDADTVAKIEKARGEGRKIIAVGTTSVRVLESAWEKGTGDSNNSPHSLKGNTSIFIYPGYRFKVVDALFTNFHTPESTLLMLVSAFADTNMAGKSGRELILESYAEAIRGDYRFFSYGDAMLIV